MGVTPRADFLDLVIFSKNVWSVLGLHPLPSMFDYIFSLRWKILISKMFLLKTWRDENSDSLLRRHCVKDGLAATNIV